MATPQTSPVANDQPSLLDLLNKQLTLNGIAVLLGGGGDCVIMFASKVDRCCS